MAESVREILRLVFTTSEGKTHSVSFRDPKGYLEKFSGRKCIACGELVPKDSNLQAFLIE
jgi:hypothetical protein